METRRKDYWQTKPNDNGQMLGSGSSKRGKKFLTLKMGEL